MRHVASVLMFALAYFATGEIGLLIDTGHTGVTPLWPPSGASMFAILVFGIRMWPGMALGLVALALHNGVPVLASVMAFAGHLCEALVGRHFFRRFQLEPSLESSRDVLRFTLFVALLPPMLSAVVGSFGMAMAGANPWEEIPGMWLSWWLGDATGIMVITPLLLAWSRSPGKRFGGWRGVEFALLLVVLSGLGWFTFGTSSHGAAASPPLFYLLIPTTVWAAIRFGLHGSSLASLVICGWLLWGAARGTGPFFAIGGIATVLSEVAFIVVTAASSLTVSALFRERQRAEEMLRRSRRELEARVRERTFEIELARDQAEDANHAKSRFLAHMSHELRTPMNGVIGFTNLLMKMELGPTQREYVEIIKRSAGDLLVIINDVLDISRIESSSLEIRRIPFSLHECIDDVIHLLAPAADDKGLELTKKRDTDVPDRVLGDPVRIRQVLINLVANAIRFTHAGKVHLRIRAARSDERSTSLHFAVQDTGVGVREEDQADLFRAFHQLDSNGDTPSSGAGLGLAISKSLVELMGGSIGVESVFGKGSTFWFHIPIDEIRSAEVPIDETPSFETEKKRSAHVLIVDDCPVNRKLVRTLLTRAGIRVEEATDGERAVSLVSAQRFDLVLMDIRMARLDGIEATKRIRALEHGRYRTPIVALTAHALPNEREQFIRTGMDDCLTKPVIEQELLEVLEQYAFTGRVGERARIA